MSESCASLKFYNYTGRFHCEHICFSQAQVKMLSRDKERAESGDWGTPWKTPDTIRLIFVSYLFFLQNIYKNSDSRLMCCPNFLF